MNENKDLHLLYKNIGETPNERILRFKKDNPEYEGIPMTYAGRLDPMAEGLLLVLSGEEIKNKDEFTDLQKTYEFEVLWGFETDTLDVLGLVSTKSDSLAPSQNIISSSLQKFVGKFEQRYPDYSSKPVQGKPLFQWAREGRLGEVEIPSHSVNVFSASFLSRRSISNPGLLDLIKSKIMSVSGDFRQTEIVEGWIDILNKRDDREFVIDRISLTASSGFYVRQFVSDLAKTLGVVATTFHIKRTGIGDYSVAGSFK